jgi:hypothetical protein
MAKKTKKKARKRKPVVMDVKDFQSKVGKIVRAVEGRLRAGKPLPLFEVLIDGKGQANVLIKALPTDEPHEFGHLLGHVLRTHAKLYASSFGGPENKAVADILDGLIHELEDILREAQYGGLQLDEDRRVH